MSSIADRGARRPYDSRRASSPCYRVGLMQQVAPVGDSAGFLARRQLLKVFRLGFGEFGELLGSRTVPGSATHLLPTGAWPGWSPASTCPSSWASRLGLPALRIIITTLASALPPLIVVPPPSGRLLSTRNTSIPSRSPFCPSAVTMTWGLSLLASFELSRATGSSASRPIQQFPQIALAAENWACHAVTMLLQPFAPVRKAKGLSLRLRRTPLRSRGQLGEATALKASVGGRTETGNRSCRIQPNPP